MCALSLVLTVLALVVELVWLVALLPREHLAIWPVATGICLAMLGCVCAGIARHKARRGTGRRQFAKSAGWFAIAVLIVGFVEALLLLWRSTSLKFY